MPRRKNAKLDFRVWDGEGHDNFPDKLHRMVLLANSDGEYILNENGLSTIQCIKFLLQTRERKHDVWFSFGYDVCKMLTDVPLFAKNDDDVQNLETLWRFGFTIYKGFKLQYIPRKIFAVYGFSAKEKFYSSDTFTFFQRNFIESCEKWNIVIPDIVREGKKSRNIFNTWPIERILEYNFVELQLAKELICKLRDALVETDLVPRKWHGPGALAGTYFEKHKLRKHWGDSHILPEMRLPIKHAYFGGRTDIVSVGEVEVYRYDIVSAYPYALTDCMSFENAGWYYQPLPFVDDRHALYHVKWSVPKGTKWGPFPWRKNNGSVLFPTDGEGWYWGIEIFAAEKLFPNCIERKGAYFCWTPKRYPFKDLIEKEYAKRFAVGTKTGAGISIKLLLNSLYGKLCQSIGEPKWQHYVWGGYITAFTRARMLEVIREVGDENVVSILTDGIFTKKRIRVDRLYKDSLGSWESQGKATLLQVGAGLYTIYLGNKPIVFKARGMPHGINHAWILREWGCFTTREGTGENTFTSSFTSFVGMGKALHQNKPFGQWITETRTLSNVTFSGTSKRVPTAPMLYQNVWKEMELQIRERPLNHPMLSHPYKHSIDREQEEKIEEEIADFEI